MTTNETSVPTPAPTAVEAAVRAAAACAKVVPLKPLTDDDAIAWLRSQPGGRTMLSQAQLAKRWGSDWYPMRVSRCLREWQDEGLIRREDGAVIAVMPPVTTPVPDALTERVADRITNAVMPPVTVPDLRESGAANVLVKRAHTIRASYVLRAAKAKPSNTDNVTRVTAPVTARVIPPPVPSRLEVDLNALRHDIREYARLHRKVEKLKERRQRDERWGRVSDQVCRFVFLGIGVAFFALIAVAAVS